MALLWKEWRQQKWIFLGGLAAGLAFPIIEYVASWINNYCISTESGSAILMLGGAIYAVILAIASMHHDTRRGIDTFLLSKPINLRHFFTIKFVLAACLLCIVFLGTISLDLITNLIGRNDTAMFAWKIFCYTYPIALLLYAVSVFFMVITRDTAKAAFLAIWTGALVYFLPLVLNGFKWINLFELMENNQNSIMAHLFKSLWDWRENSFGNWLLNALSEYQWEYFLDYLLFLATMLSGAIFFVILSIKAERSHWRWRPEQKSIVWTLGASAAVIFGLALLQIGHNLTPVKELNGKPLANPVEFDWSKGIELLNEGLPTGVSIIPDSTNYDDYGNAMCIKDDLMFRFVAGNQSCGSEETSGGERVCYFVLQVYRFPWTEINNRHSDSDVATSFQISAIPFFKTEPAYAWRQLTVSCFARGDRLYAAYQPNHIKGKREDGEVYYPGSLNPTFFITFDISDPIRPKVVSDMEISRSDHSVRTMAHIDDYCYIDDGSQLMILMLEDPNKPNVVHRVDLEDEYINKSLTLSKESIKRMWSQSRHLIVFDNKLINWDFHRVRIMDIADKLNPHIIYDDALNYTGDSLDYISGCTFKENKLYITNRKGIYVFRVDWNKDKPCTMTLIGYRMVTTLERLAGRDPDALLLKDNYLIEQTGRFGVLVYDVSNPSIPRRVYHAQVSNYANKIGLWNGLLYVQEHNNGMSFYELPKKQTK